MKPVKHKMDHSVWREVSCEVRGEVWHEVSYVVWRDVNDEVWGEVSEVINNETS